MSNRIQPECFIEVWEWDDGFIDMNKRPVHIDRFDRSLKIGAYLVKTVALFLIRLKTQQEKENSIYYPSALNQTK